MGELPPRFLQERFSPPRLPKPLAGAAQPVAHKPLPVSPTERALRKPTPTLGLQLDITPLPESIADTQDVKQGWPGQPNSPPLTPRSASAEASPTGGGRKATGRAAAELWSAGGKPRSADPVKTNFSVKEMEMTGEVRGRVASGLRRTAVAGAGARKRDLYAARRSLP